MVQAPTGKREGERSKLIPQFGSIWKAPNRIWTSGFARHSEKNEIHPSVIEKIYTDKITVSLVPGTSIEKRGSCVFKADLTNDEIIFQ